MPGLGLLLLAGLAVLVGAVVQSGVGLGLGLVAAPVVTLLDPSLMPGTMLVVSATLPLLTLLREWRHADWRGVGWAFGGRLAGTVVGVWVVAVLPQRALGIAVGVMVLVAVVLTAGAVRIRDTPGALVTAGIVSGVTGTSTSIGGPPIALVYQHAPGPRVRATLAVLFCAGALLSLASLGAVGELPHREVVTGLFLVPFVVAGFGLSTPLRRYLDGGRTRAAVLAVTAASAALLIARSLLS